MPASERRRLAPRRIATWAIVLLLGAQAIRPSRVNPPVDPSRTLQASGLATPEVLGIIDRSCKNCHTNGTEWPWYSQVAPASWLLVMHVGNGRRHLNFSEWTTYDQKTAGRKLAALCENVTTGEMPMTSYTLVHETARLSEDDKQVLCAWTEKVKP